MARGPSVILLASLLLVSSLSLVIHPAVAAEQPTRTYSGLLTLSASVASNDPTFYEQFTMSASVSVPLQMDATWVGSYWEGRYPASGSITASYSGEFSITFRNIGCSATGAGSVSGSLSGTVSYHLALGSSFEEGTINLGIVVDRHEGSSVRDYDYCVAPYGDPFDLLFGYVAGDAYGALATITRGGQNFYGLIFPLDGGKQQYSGVIEGWESSYRQTHYEGKAELSLVSTTEPTETTTTTTTSDGPFDFDFSVEPMEAEVILGSSVQFEVTVVVLQGTPELVALRAPGSDYGVTYTFLESGSNVFVDIPPYTVTLVVSTSEYTDLGRWSFEIWADTQSGLLHKQTVYFTVLDEAAPKVCPRLSLVPELPTVSGERVSPKDSTSYRLSLEWGGSIPASGLPVSYSVSELSGLNLEALGIVASFTFNPVTIYQSSVSHLLQIQTKGASEGAYDIVVVATVEDPSSGLTCSAEAVVALEVSEDFVTRLTFPTLGRVSSIQGNVEIAKGESGEKLQASTGSEVNVGDILVTGSDSDTIIGIESKNGLVQLWKDTATMFVGIERRAESNGTEVVLTLLPRATACQGLSDSALVRCDLFYEFLAESGIPERLAPEFLGTVVLLSMWQGVMHFHSGDYEGELTIDWILTRNVAIAPFGTDFTVEVASDGTTTVSTFEGVVIVVDLVSGDRVRLGSNEQLVLPEVAGLSEEEMSSLTTTFDPNTVTRWWEPQPLFQAQALTIGLPVAAAALIVAIGAIVLKRRSRRTKTMTVKPPPDKAVPTPSVTSTTEHPQLPRPRWYRRPRTIFLEGILLSLASFFIASSLGLGLWDCFFFLLWDCFFFTYLAGLFLLGLLLSGIVAPIKLAVDKARDRRRKRISPATLVAPSAVLTPQESKYCRYCGEQLLADSVFCNHCGKKQ